MNKQELKYYNQSMAVLHSLYENESYLLREDGVSEIVVFDKSKRSGLLAQQKLIRYEEKVLLKAKKRMENLVGNDNALLSKYMETGSLKETASAFMYSTSSIKRRIDELCKKS